MEKQNQQNISFDEIQETDQLNGKMEIVGALGETGQLLKSDVTQGDDKINTTQKVAKRKVIILINSRIRRILRDKQRLMIFL